MQRVIGYVVGSNIRGNIRSKTVKPYKTLWRLVLKINKYGRNEVYYEVAKINIDPTEWLQRESYYGKPVVNEGFDEDEFINQYLYY